MEDLTRLRELKEMHEHELLSDEEFSSRKLAVVRRMLSDPSSAAAALAASPSSRVVSAPTTKAAPAKRGPEVVKKTLVSRDTPPVLSRVSANARKGPAPVRSWPPDALEKRSCSMEEAAEEEQRVVEWCEENGCKWTDESFPHCNESIARTRQRLLKNVHHWDRLTERSPNPSLFVGGSGSGDVIQGELGDCYFLGALAMCATRQDDLLYPLFVSARPEYGFFQIRFFVDAAWRVVTVDDYVPVKASGAMIFGHCKNEDEYWVALVEKANAKLVGCYENLGSGNFSEAMSNLTGEGSEAFALTPDMAESDEMWNKLEYYVQEAFLMGCSIEGVGEHDNGMGLLTGHAYGIISCRVTKKDKIRLLQLFNPWGMKEWEGAWSDGSKEWTPALMKELGQTDEDDGMFWITYEDFLKNFNMFSVCRLLTDDIGKVWQKIVFANEWDASNAGGCCNYADSWARNPQYWLTVTEQTQLFVHLARQDGRVHGKPIFTDAIGCYLFQERDLTKRKVHRYPNDVFGGKQPLFIASREYSYSAVVPPGNYILMPCCFDPHQYGRFFLSVYSEDPVICGEMGYGPSKPSEVVRIDTRKIAELNRPDDDDEPGPQPVSPPAPRVVERATTKVAEPVKAVSTNDPICCVCFESTKGGGKCFRMNGERYHVRCFRCAACDCALDPSDFFQDSQGRAVCADHVDD